MKSIDIDERDGFASLCDSELIAALDRALYSLSRREAEALILRFGLCGERPHTLCEIAERIGKKSDPRIPIKRERVRQIIDKSIRKLRHPSRANIIRPFMEGKR